MQLAEGSGVGGNQEVTTEQVAKIRALADFDIVMLISEIHDHGWPMAEKTLEAMPVAKDRAS